MRTRPLPGTLVAVLALCLSWAAGAALAQEAAPAVTVVRAESGPLVETASVSGTLVARQEISVVPEIAGARVVELLADVGDVVEAGAVVARLDPADVRTRIAQAEAASARAEAAVGQAEAGLTRAEANAGELRTEADRSRRLAEQGTLPAATRDQAVAAADTAAADVEAARAALAAAEADLRTSEVQEEAAQLDLSRTEVKAPAGGLVLSRDARVGAASAATPLFTLAQDGVVELEAEAIETDLARIEAGQGAAVELPGGREASGEVRLVAPVIDPATRLGTVRIALGDGPRPSVGGFARAVIETGRREAVTLPVAAVLSDETGDSVAMVRPGEDGTGTVERREVETGAVSGGRIEIVSGVKGGDLVLARAGSFYREGDVVAPVEEAGGAAPSAPAPAEVAEDGR